MINHNEETSMDLMSNDHRIKSVLGRLEMIIDNENDNIGKDPQFDFKVSNAHKSRCLYELTMLFRDTPMRKSPPDISIRCRASSPSSRPMPAAWRRI